MDAAINEVRGKAVDVGVTLQDEKRNIEWKVDWLMFADDAVLLGDSEEKLERLQEFGRVCQRRKLSLNKTKSKIMKIGKNVEENGVNISLNDRRMAEVEIYRYLGVDISSDGGMGEDRLKCNHCAVSVSGLVV